MYANLLRSSPQSSPFLVNASRAGIEAHTMILYADDAVGKILHPSTSLRRTRRLPGSNGHNRRTSVLHQTLMPPSPESQVWIAFLQGSLEYHLPNLLYLTYHSHLYEENEFRTHNATL